MIFTSNTFACWKVKIRSMYVYSTEGQIHQSTSTFCAVGLFFLIPGAKQSLKVRSNAFAPPLDTYTHRKDVSVFLRLPFQSDVGHRSTWWKMKQSLSLTTYQLTTCINLTVLSLRSHLPPPDANYLSHISLAFPTSSCFSSLLPPIAASMSSVSPAASGFVLATV